MFCRRPSGFPQRLEHGFLLLEPDQLCGDAGSLKGGTKVFVRNVRQPLVEYALASVGGEAVPVPSLPL